MKQKRTKQLTFVNYSIPLFIVTFSEPKEEPFRRDLSNISLLERFNKYDTWKTRKQSIANIDKYCNQSTKESIQLALIPKHIKESFPHRFPSYIRDANTLPKIETFVHKEPTRKPTILSKTIWQQSLLRRKQCIEGMSIKLEPEPNTEPNLVVSRLKAYSANMRDDQRTLEQLKTKVAENRKELFKPKLIPHDTDPEWTYPSRSELETRRAFGKKNLAKSYRVSPSLSQIAVFIWKYNYDPEVSEELAIAHGAVGLKARKCVEKLKRIDFSPLQLLPLDWDLKEETEEEEEKVQQNKQLLMDACLLHYNMDLESVQAFCGGRWMGEHRRTVEMLRVLSQFVPTELYIPFAQTMVDGVPNCLYGNVPKEELERNLSMPNLKSAEQKPEVVKKKYSIKKERTT